MHKYILILLISVFSFSKSHAQTRLSVSSEYLMPMGKMKWPYKPGIGADINLARVNDENTLTKFVGISIGYAALQPHADTLYYVYDYGGVDGIVVGRAAYSSFKMLRFKVNLEYALPLLGKKVDFTFGGALGGVYGIRSMSFTDDRGGGTGSDEIVPWAMLTPRCGFAYKLNDAVSIEPHISYTVLIQAGSTNPDALNYNENTGLGYNYYSLGLSFNFSL